MSVVYFTADWMFATQATAAAKDRSLGMKVVGDAATLAAACDQDTTLVIVDLESAAGGLAEIVSIVLAGQGERPQIVAYGPHVHEGRLAAARQAGCDSVLSKGKFHAQMQSLLQEHAG